ncbi:MAG: hypothetical protein HY043_24205 [Verrucomicrobia bacterium]|nr:hypothetical protein [Verrucomicrobiota bacterium]
MQVNNFIEETSRQVVPQIRDPALRVFIAYNDIAAGKHAMQVVTDLGKSSGDDFEFEPLPWSFEELGDVYWREVAARDAAEADILIIATSGLRPLPPAVEQWAETVINRKRGTSAAIVALFGPEEDPDGAGSTRLEAIQTAAQQAGLDFFAPTPRHELNQAMDRIHQRAEMVTPVLEGILHHPLPVCHAQI